MHHVLVKTFPSEHLFKPSFWISNILVPFCWIKGEKNIFRYEIVFVINIWRQKIEVYWKICLFCIVFNSITPLLQLQTYHDKLCLSEEQSAITKPDKTGLACSVGKKKIILHLISKAYWYDQPLKGCLLLTKSHLIATHRGLSYFFPFIFIRITLTE